MCPPVFSPINSSVHARHYGTKSHSDLPLNTNNPNSDRADTAKLFTHLSEKEGWKPAMVDVSLKAATHREAVAQGKLLFSRAVEGLDALPSAKGSVIGTAQLAGILGAKQTSQLIPLCHPLFLSHIKVQVDLVSSTEVSVTCTAKTFGATGVEMEALTGCSVALLAVYDMCKSFDKGMQITSVRVVSKRGGASGDYKAT